MTKQLSDYAEKADKESAQDVKSSKKLIDYANMTDEELMQEGVTRAEIDYMLEESEAGANEIESLNNMCKVMKSMNKKFDALLDLFQEFIAIQNQDIPDMDFIEIRMDALEKLQTIEPQTEETQKKVMQNVAEILDEINNALGRSNV